MRGLARTACAVLICLCLAPSPGQGQATEWWTNEEINDWIEAMEGAVSLADFAGDTTCAQAFSDAAGGLGSAQIGTTPGLTYRGREVNGLWSSLTWPFRNRIRINSASDDLGRTVFHEALNEADYIHGDIYRLAGRPGGAGGECRNYLSDPRT